MPSSLRVPIRVVAAVLLIVPPAAHANAGIPVGTYSILWTVLLFVPIVLAEAAVLRMDLSVSYVRALATMVPANLASTLAGVVVPILTAPLMATEGILTTFATLMLFVPLYFLSTAIEGVYATWSIAPREGAAIRISVRRANLASYAMLSCFVLARFAKSWYVNGRLI